MCPEVFVFPHERMTAKELVDIVRGDGRSIHDLEIVPFIDGAVRFVGTQGQVSVCFSFFEYGMAERVVEVPYVFFQPRNLFTHRCDRSFRPVSMFLSSR